MRTLEILKNKECDVEPISGVLVYLSPVYLSVMSWKIRNPAVSVEELSFFTTDTQLKSDGFSIRISVEFEGTSQGTMLLKSFVFLAPILPSQEIVMTMSVA